jgi:hypothetical protein
VGAKLRRFTRGEVQDKNHEINLGRNTMKTILATLGISALLGVLAALAVIYSGIFNVAATVEDASPLRWVFITTREASIKRHARDIQTPMAKGLNPQAPGFAENDMSAAELFWTAKNGIRFTGMPAWGPSRSDQEIWDMVAFIQVLPKMSAVDYDALDRRVPSGPGPQKQVTRYRRTVPVPS